MTVSKGSTYTVDSTAPSQNGLDCARISDTQMLAAYSNSTSDPHLGAMVLDINTGTKVVSLNTEYTFTHAFQLDELIMARLSATKFMFVTRIGRARILNVSGTVVTAGPIGTISSFSIFGATRVIPITSTTALYTYSDGSDFLARVLTIDGSDNITEGNVVTVATSTGAGLTVYDVALYTTSKAAVFFQDDASGNFYLRGQLVSISGTTLTLDGSAQTIYTTKVGWETGVAVAAISSSEVVVSHDVEAAAFTYGMVNHVVSLSGSTLSPGSTLEIPESQLTLGLDFMFPSKAVATNAATILINGPGLAATAGSTSRVTQITKSGSTLSYTTNDYVDISTSVEMAMNSIKKIVDDFALVCTLGTKDATIIGSDAAPVPAFSGYDLVLGGGLP